MSIPSLQQLHAALSDDLKKHGTNGVSSDVTRKTFSMRVHGAVLEFGHKQADPAFWSGVKHYASGPSSRFRMPRTAMAMDAPVEKPKARRKVKVAEVAAAETPATE